MPKSGIVALASSEAHIDKRGTLAGVVMELRRSILEVLSDQDMKWIRVKDESEESAHDDVAKELLQDSDAKRIEDEDEDHAQKKVRAKIKGAVKAKAKTINATSGKGH